MASPKTMAEKLGLRKYDVDKLIAQYEGVLEDIADIQNAFQCGLEATCYYSGGRENYDMEERGARFYDFLLCELRIRRDDLKCEKLDGRNSMDKAKQLKDLLRSKLSSFGGKEVILQKNLEDSYKILEYGKLWDKNTYILPNPKRHPCELWQELQDEGAEGFYLVMGYVLCSDGIWRERLWLSWNNGEREMIGETNKSHELYYGYVLSEKEAEDICRYFGFAQRSSKE